jgi:xanthine dehydrogenase accessory factor
MSLFVELKQVIENGEAAVVFTVVEGEPLGAKLLVRPDGTTAGDGPAELAAEVPELLARGRSGMLESEREGRRVFADVFAPPPRLLVFGAVDTAEALCAAAKQLGWTTIVADARSRFATGERLPSADEIIVSWPAEAIARVQPDARTAVVVLTHDEKFDVPALQGALATEAFYVGALGSRRAQASRRERLLEAGVPESELDRIAGPCGLDIGAESSPETAISILAEMLAARAGRDGGRLRDAAGSIHVERSEVSLGAEKGLRT